MLTCEDETRREGGRIVGCNVCINSDYDSLPDFCSKEVRIARSQHTCCECRETILPGQEYEYVAGKWDGDFSIFKTCSACVSIRDGLSCDGSYVFTTLWEDIGELFPYLTTGCLSKIGSAAGKKKLLDRWREWRLLASS